MLKLVRFWTNWLRENFLRHFFSYVFLYTNADGWFRKIYGSILCGRALLYKEQRQNVLEHSTSRFPVLTIGHWCVANWTPPRNILWGGGSRFHLPIVTLCARYLYLHFGIFLWLLNFHFHQWFAISRIGTPFHGGIFHGEGRGQISSPDRDYCCCI